MATTIKIKNSVTATTTPTSLVQGEVAINVTDKKVWVGNAATTPIQIVGAGTTGNAAGSNTQVQYNSSGSFAGDADFTFNGTTVTMTNDASISGLTVGRGAGAVASNTALGSSALVSNTTGVANSGFGFSALTATTTGNYNTAVGYQTGVAITTSDYNSGLGWRAIYTNTTGANNTAIGSQALYSNTTASNNTAVGTQAGYNNTTGDKNTFLGTYAGFEVSTGVENTYVGYGAGPNGTASTGSYNTAVGRAALQSNTTASSNTAVGYQALYSNTTGTPNDAFGYQAGYANTTGTENVFIGHSAGSGVTTGSKNTFVGRVAGLNVTTGSDNTGIGRYSLYGLTTGIQNVGLGDMLIGGQIFVITTESNRLIAGHDSITNAYVKVAWTVTSDARDKTDFADSPYGLDFVNKLKPVTFKWDERSKYDNGIPDGTHKGSKTQLGFLAQDVIALEQSLGTPSNDLLIADNEQEDKLKITESKIIPALVKAIQELKAEVDSLKAQLNNGA